MKLAVSCICAMWVSSGCATVRSEQTAARPEHPPALGGPTAARPEHPAALSEDAAANWFEDHRNQPTALREFLHRMPKGGDLHSHLSGAVYAETYLEIAAERDYCVWETEKGFDLDKCTKEGKGLAKPTKIADILTGDPRLYNRLIDAMSTRNLAFSGRTGHDQFFDTFGTFGAVSDLLLDNMVAEVAARAAEQNVQYVELMTTFQGTAVRKVGKEVGFDDSRLSAMHEKLGKELAALLDDAERELDELEKATRDTMKCGGEEPSPGCGVTVRYLQQTTRTKSPAEVFAQLTFATELVRRDPHVVGLNLVAPEDDYVALRDYSTQMRMLDFLVKGEPDVNVALHAGELSLGFVPPHHLRSHIREAVELGHAKRIGHGVDISYERDARKLLDTMRDGGVLVEICLTSNDVILDVRGDQHPLPLYLAAGVPTTLATDDEGVSRIDLTHEYLRAATTYGLGYRELKRFARNSLQHSFLPGRSLWSNPTTFEVDDACKADRLGVEPSRRCRALLDAHEKAREQWKLEAAFVTFESTFVRLSP